MMINYQKMYIYKLHRSNELDHQYGRPAIFLHYLGQESLVWFGTTVKYKNSNQETPLILMLNGKTTYFYNKGLSKVLTQALVGKWRDNQTQKIMRLNFYQQEQLISKFLQLTLIDNPFLEIKYLKQKLVKIEQRLSAITDSYSNQLADNIKLQKEYLKIKEKLKSKEEQNNGQQFNP